MGARGRLTLGRGAPECRPARTEREAPPSASAAATAHPPSPPTPALGPTAEPAPRFAGVKAAACGRGGGRLNRALASCPRARSLAILREQEGACRTDRRFGSTAGRVEPLTSSELRGGTRLDMVFTEPSPGAWHLTSCLGMSCDELCDSRCGCPSVLATSLAV